ncbi:UDP-glucose--hexose-1-phosphate uridylyltransferase [Trichostrongylus colubriformis]|uniref:Galactose-1-phosphate uridylyltransferase n=1 Tax=Trichostrongylus colubriformis TaxID=6319 RepID=A0AAN8IVK4_TRICO
MSQKNNHRRYNPLLDEWVIVAGNRVSRPWQGAHTDLPSFTTSTGINSLAPGGKRANNVVTPYYTSTFVFDNDFPSFTDFPKVSNESEKDHTPEEEELFRQMEIRGVCRVICYHPDTKQSIATMSLEEVTQVVKTWIEQFQELKEKYLWIQIFENRGAAVGCSNAHPHGQLWAGNFLPNYPSRKDKCQRDYYVRHGRPLLADVLKREQMDANERVVLQNQHWTVFVPYWAVWPYETMLLPNRHVLRLDDLNEEEQVALAGILQRLIIKYDNIFECPFPFSMGWLGAPTGPLLGDDNQCWYLHASFHPPLLRSATVPKYIAGYEMFSEPQRDITPEAAADALFKLMEFF